MHRRDLLVFSAVVVGAMLLLGVWAWLQLPADAQVPIHWGIDGQPNAYAGKTIGLFLVPLITAVAAAVFWAIPVIEPRRANIEKSGKAYRVIWIGTVVLLAVVDLAVIGAALGGTFNVFLAVFVGDGSLLHRHRQLPAEGPPELPDRDPDALDADQRPGVGSDAPGRRQAVRASKGSCSSSSG